MSTINYQLYAFLLASLLWLNLLGAQAQLLDEDEDVFGRPWPTYSLQNMPKTQFTCRDKILGGYYADPETQCQMFHVCVKLPGIGVQDYRFLCPNSTAFDQELQICANWVDVDCDKATSYYDNNNLNDLYRGGDESKNANGEEDEATFHLQRAESGDVRRNKENRADQKSRPRHNYAQSSSNLNVDTSKRPITSYYTPTTGSSTTTTTKTTTTTERNYYNNHHSNSNNNNNNYNNDDSKQDIDDIFKGSHSSHFFSNRHGGREFDEEPAARPKPNDFNDYNRKTTEAVSKTRATPTRGQRTSTPTTAAAATTTTRTPSTTTTTTIAPTIKKITLHASFNTDFQDYSPYYKSTTPSTLAPTAATTPRLGGSITSRFSFGLNDYQTQERIQPTTYNPNNAYRFRSTEHPASSTKLTGKNLQDFDKETTRRHKPTIAARKQKLGPQESNYINHNEFADVAKPKPFQATQSAPKKSIQLEPQYQRPRTTQLGRVGNQEPAPFKAAPSGKPRSFTSRGSITYKATTQRYADDEYHYPTTTSTLSPKKQSSQTPRDAFTPTTFRPTTYKKAYEQSYYQTQQTLRPSANPGKKTTSAAAVTAALPTTANPYYNVDEDDGQYHPELYENDFPRNRFKFLRNRSNAAGSSSSTTSSTTAAPYSSRQPHGFQQAHSHLKSQQQSAYQKERDHEQSDLSDEDELFKTAQSLNFGAASINKLRADIYKAEKTSQQYNSQYSPHALPSSPKTTAQTTSRPTTQQHHYSSSSSSSSGSTITTTTSTTRRPTTTSTTARTTTTTSTTTSSTVAHKKSVKSRKEEKKSKSSGKRPAHADEDTSYDYAYYDTD